MRWLRRFFSSDDPAVRLVGALSEPEAEMWREALANEGIPSASKNTDGVAVAYSASSGQSIDLFVKQSDLARARETLGPAAEPGEEH